MTTPTVPLIDGAYYWVQRDSGWDVGRLLADGFAFACEHDVFPFRDVNAISGPIPTPDGEGE